ncbi:MAG: hypothetical protein JXR68_04760 [Bacteroidales bacterium]|nr:hypothetical protein [Bacteroidales bacterium]
MFQIGFLSTNIAYVAILTAFYISYLGVYFNKSHEPNFNSVIIENTENNFGTPIFYQTKIEKSFKNSRELSSDINLNFTNTISNNFCKIKILFIRKKNIVYSNIFQCIYIRPPPFF